MPVVLGNRVSIACLSQKINAQQISLFLDIRNVGNSLIHLDTDRTKRRKGEEMAFPVCEILSLFTLTKITTA
ncbi:hypothetical protein STEG23_002173, partial [Scotinomys teguina]